MEEVIRFFESHHKGVLSNPMVECVSVQDQSRLKRSTVSTKIFADLMVEQIRKRNRGSGAFSMLAWKIKRDEFNKQTDLNFNKQQLKNHFDVLRKRYDSVKAILDHTYFSWDVAQYMVLAEDDVWQEYIEAHPEVDIIRKRGCDIYDQFCIIFSSNFGINESHVVAVSGTASHQITKISRSVGWALRPIPFSSESSFHLPLSLSLDLLSA